MADSGYKSAILSTAVTWDDFCAAEALDQRTTKAINRLGFAHPTHIQCTSIRTALGGKDLLIRSKTGSGKTLAYAIPLVEKLLRMEQSDRKALSAVVLVPTKELAVQVFGVINSLLAFSSDTLTAEFFVAGKKPSYNRPQISSILVSTPANLVQLVELKVKQPTLDALKILCIDEADSILSSSGKDCMDRISGWLPSSGCQCLLVSATLSTDVNRLAGLMLHNPETIAIDETLQDTAEQMDADLSQFYLPCHEEEKYLVVYGLLRLNLISGRVLMFANTVDKAYRMKMFLTRFSIPCGVLNPELPFSQRQAVLSQFNEGAFNLLIATGSHSAHRGLDFSRVQIVVNIDMPTDVPSYIHRVGRTARGGDVGTALSLVVTDSDQDLAVLDQLTLGCELDKKATEKTYAADKEAEAPAKEDVKSDDEGSESDPESAADGENESDEGEEEVEDSQSDEGEEKSMEEEEEEEKEDVKSEAGSEEGGHQVKRIPLESEKLHIKVDIEKLGLDLSDLRSLKYRVDDVLSGLSRKAVAAFRQKEVLAEAMSAQKLKEHLDENSADAITLKRNIRALKDQASGGAGAGATKQHLKYLPSYLLPESIAEDKVNSKQQAYEPVSLTGTKRKKDDPLRTFGARRQATSHRQRLLRYEPTEEDHKATVETLPPIAGRKIWKLQHKKKLRKGLTDRTGKASASNIRKRGKRFDANAKLARKK